jgi:hypothetical protein
LPSNASAKRERPNGRWIQLKPLVSTENIQRSYPTLVDSTDQRMSA